MTLSGTTTPTRNSARGPARLAPLTGLLFGGLTMAGNLIIGPFPEADTPAGDLPAYYAIHAGHVAIGATLLAWGAVFFAFFGAALATRMRQASAPPVLVSAVLVGTAVETVLALFGAATLTLLSRIGLESNVSPAALQASQISASEFGSSAGIAIVLCAVAVAGIGYRAVPRSMAWTALVLGLAQMIPVGYYAFWASLVFLLWAAVVGIVLAILPDRRPVPAGDMPAVLVG